MAGLLGCHLGPSLSAGPWQYVGFEVTISGQGPRGGPIGAGLFMMPAGASRSGGARPHAASPADLAAAGEAKRAAARALGGHGTGLGLGGQAPPPGFVTLFADPVRAGLAAPLTFQWKHLGKVMKGETGQSVTVPVAASMEYSAYTCTVLDADRVAVSRDFLVRVVGASDAGRGVFSDAAYRASRTAASGLSPTKGKGVP
jgi:hypothetical protein